MVEASAVADLAAQALAATQPPAPLPPGWLLKESRSQPGVYYYFNQETGESTWESPYMEMEPEEEESGDPQLEHEYAVNVKLEDNDDENMKIKLDENNSHMIVKSDNNENNNALEQVTAKRSRDPVAIKTEEPQNHDDVEEEEEDQKPLKRQRKVPREVRVLHILKKHKDSKRPASWRSNNKPITITLQDAREELEGLLEILREEQGNPDNLIATFKELAAQESDCSSAKRKGDLGLFGRKKMRPEFEEAAFALDVNQLSGIVETASGAHILLRLE